MQTNHISGKILIFSILFLILIQSLAPNSSGEKNPLLARNPIRLSGNHPPIYINGNDNFTSANGVIGGQGTEADPYVIGDWVIASNGENGPGIWITNTTAFFVILNCTVRGFSNDHSHAIYLKNVRNGQLTAVDVFDDYVGIGIYNSNNIGISNTTCHDSTGYYSYGFYCEYSTNITMSSCSFWNISGISAIPCHFYSVAYLLVEQISVHDNKGMSGLRVGVAPRTTQGRHLCIVRDCKIFNDSGEAFSLAYFSDIRRPAYVLVQRCEIYNCGYPDEFLHYNFDTFTVAGLYNTIIEDCSAHNNAVEGMYMDGCANSVVRNCSFYNQSRSDNIIASGLIISGAYQFGMFAWNVTVEHCNIYNNQWGLSLADIPSFKIHHNAIYNNSEYGVFRMYMFPKISTGYFRDNNIFGNGYEGGIFDRGFYAERGIYDCRNNWWGSSDGPTFWKGGILGNHITHFGHGHGDGFETFEGWAFYRPWLRSPVPDAGRQTQPPITRD
jgi:parallel beta-helix repeat protein